MRGIRPLAHVGNLGIRRRIIVHAFVVCDLVERFRLAKSGQLVVHREPAVLLFERVGNRAAFGRGARLAAAHGEQRTHRQERND